MSETVREKSGLASSSRNGNLSEIEKIHAEIIYQTMLIAKTLAIDNSPQEVKKRRLNFLITEILNSNIRR